MAIKNGKPNPLNYFDLRRVDFPAFHFHFTHLSKNTPNYIKQIDQWIYQNLNSRYYVGQALELNQDNNIVYVTRVGFEAEKELSFFRIACPLLY
jgi:hypothetical protein